MVTAGDFRKGVTFEKDGQPCLVVDFQHVKPGKGAAFVRTKYKNLRTGAIREEAFNPSDKFPKAIIETKQMQYLYNDGELYYFMDEETFDQIPLNYEQARLIFVFLVEMGFHHVGQYKILKRKRSSNNKILSRTTIPSRSSKLCRIRSNWNWTRYKRWYSK